MRIDPLPTDNRQLADLIVRLVLISEDSTVIRNDLADIISQIRLQERDELAIMKEYFNGPEGKAAQRDFAEFLENRLLAEILDPNS